MEIKKVNIYVGEVGAAYVNKETAKANLDSAIKNVSDVENIIELTDSYLEQAIAIKEDAIDAQTLAEQVKNDLQNKINQFNNNELVYTQLQELLNSLNDNDEDGDYLNGGGVSTATDNVEFIDNLIEELNAIKTAATSLLADNVEYQDTCQTAYDNAVTTFKSYIPTEEESQAEESDNAESALLARLEAVANGLEVAQATIENVNNTSTEIQEEANNIINGGETPEPHNTYYFYVGITKPASLSDASVVESYPAEQTFTNPSTTEKCYVYVLANSNKIVNIYDPADPTDALAKAEDTTTINGYKITYISADGSTPFKIAKGGSVVIKIS